MAMYCHVNVRRDLTSANTDSICRFGRRNCINKIEVPPWCRSHCRCLIPGCINQWICEKHRTRASTDRDWRTKKGTSSRGHVNSNDGTVKRILDVECYWEQCLQYTMSMTLY